MKKLIFLTTFLLFCNFGFLHGQNCPTDLPGFTFLGEYNDHHYFLSSTTAHPQDAQVAAEQNGGYLAAITSQVENNFLQQNISEMTIIGLNDVQSEDDFQWFSGEDYSYSNFDVCSFCLDNNPNNDYVIMHHWNGAWSFANVFTLRKYIVEIPCQNTSGGTPDLTLSNVTGLPSAVESGDAVNLSFNLNNIGTAGTTTNQVIAAYLSTDEFFNTGDTYLADLTVGNTPIGTTAGLELSFNIPNVVDGDYTVIIIADVNGDITELNTSNNGVKVPLTIGGGSPNTLSGFTLLGEYNDSKYYISNGNAKPIEAQIVAEQNGGFLAIIESEAENDFIQQNISEMVYIGLNDAQTEGDLEWVNGFGLSYNNINPCGFCHENSANRDYVIMAPWNGTWSFSSQWNSRRYILEIPFQSTGGGLPDFTISNVNGVPSSLGTGDQVSGAYILNNIGVGNSIFDNISIGVFLSSDQQLFSGGSGAILLDENFFNSDLLSGGSLEQTFDFEIPDVPAGDYYILVFPNYVLSPESNYDNNIFAIPISVSTSPIPPCELYETSLGDVDGFSCVEALANGNISVTIDENGIFYKKIIAPTGEIISSIEISNTESTFVIENNAIVEKAPNGNVLNSIPLEASIVNQFASGDNGFGPVIESSPIAYWVTAYERTIIYPNTPTIDGTGDETTFMLKIDGDGNLISQTLIDEFSYNANQTEYLALILTPNSGVRLFRRFGHGSAGSLHEIIISSSNIVSEIKLLGTSNNSNPVVPYFSITKVPCDYNRYRIEMGFDNGNGLNSATAFINKKYELTYIGLSATMHYSSVLKRFGVQGVSRVEFDATYYQPDGSYVTVKRDYESVPVIISDVYYLKIFDSNGNLVRTVNPDTGSSLWAPLPVYALATENEGLTQLFQSYNTDLTITTTDCNGSGGNTGNCPNDIAGFSYLGEHNGNKYFLSDDYARPTDAQAIAVQNGGNLAIINNQAENDFIQQNISEMVYIGLNDALIEGTPQWLVGTTSFANFDICSFCYDNSPQRDYVVMHNWNGGWSWSNVWNQRQYVIEIPCSQTLTSPNLPNTLITFSTENEGKLRLEQIMPNPAQDQIFVSLYSPIEDKVELQIFDARGVLVKSERVELHDGDNTVDISIQDLPSGFYFLKIPQAQIKHSMMRFVKVKD